GGQTVCVLTTDATWPSGRAPRSGTLDCDICKIRGNYLGQDRRLFSKTTNGPLGDAVATRTLERPAVSAPTHGVLGGRWWTDALWQLFVATCGYVVYSLSVGAVQWTGATKARESLAIQNAWHVVDFERLLGFFREHDLQSLIIHNEAL